MSAWFDPPSDDTAGFFSAGRRIREWTPGDGLTCSAATHNRRQPCGPPAAVIETRNLDQRRGAKPRLRVVCSRHVAETVRKAVGDAERHGPSFMVEAEKSAREAVLANHWEEYQEIFNSEMEKLETRYLDMLPEILRALVKEEVSS